MKPSLNDERGSVANALAILLLLVLIVGAIVLWQGRSVDVAELRETGESAAVDIEKAAEAIRHESLDALTTTKVKAALALSKSVSAFDIDVDSDDGVVVLTGDVPSENVKATAVRIAQDVTGVAQVTDRLGVVPGTAPVLDDDEIAARMAELEMKANVYEALLREPGTDAGRIDVTIVGDTVILEGTVAGVGDAERLGRAAASVTGVASVDNRLVVAESVTRAVPPPRPRG